MATTWSTCSACRSGPCRACESRRSRSSTFTSIAARHSPTRPGAGAPAVVVLGAPAVEAVDAPAVEAIDAPDSGAAAPGGERSTGPRGHCASLGLVMRMISLTTRSWSVPTS